MAEDLRVQGKPSRVQSHQPTVKESLVWNEKKDNFYDYKKRKEVLKHFGDYNKYKYLIDKTRSPFVSETHENYKPFNYSNKEESLKQLPIAHSLVAKENKNARFK